ncbi:homeobox-DDT domain protein RLT3 isoform X4 [Dendrobium catenatum]|uniref:homeobox-DDT domain protein RLT3 isoform X4 n=1 Tax=Dendrobium catenatum TaxID=906689 RepID=UPI0009F6C55D|nr:homeobox-DDT domain protein RLT3 isoform X4 [Dendrobium catenatum]
MPRAKKYKRGSFSRVGTESRTSSWRHKKNCCNGADCGEKKRILRVQSFLSKEYILSKVFRKDGPPLGLEFDPPPENAIGVLTDFENCHCCQDDQRIFKRRKVLKSSAADSVGIQPTKVPEKKYGMGKALMTVWRATNSCNGKFPDGSNFFNGKVHCLPFKSSKETIRQKQGKTKKKLLKKPPRRRKVPRNIDANFEKPHPSECKLMIDETHIMHQTKSVTPLVDDEELELMELESASTPFRCSEHLGSRGGHGCPLCKDVLTRFPPKIVKMKQPISAKPWDFSPELVKKLFKVFQFLYNHSTAIEICPFTLDDLAQAFRDKDSFLLGNIHVELLRLLLSSVKSAVSAGFVSRSSKDCRFLSLLHYIREQEFDLDIWRQSLNSLSWTEILRQVSLAAGFGAKHNSASRDIFSKERNQMANYGLRPCTLKGELFQILLKQGSLGLKVAELVKIPQIVTLDLPSTTEEQEELIKSTLSSDITLFEKIGPAAYRLRCNHQMKGKNGNQSEDDDSGSVEDEYSDAYRNGSSDDSEGESSMACGQRIIKYKRMHVRAQQKLIECSEIDESYTGEAWVQGLVEGDYSNLSTGEKLDALVALVDLIGSCSSDLGGPMSALTPSVHYLGPGAKIKRQPSKINPTSSNIWEVPADSVVERHMLRNLSRSGSSRSSSTVSKKGHSSGRTEAMLPDVHPLKSIHLGSDRRYNNYWLFLGPCDATDPGHRRIYFESSEDGHWQVIETTQALRDLLLALDRRGTREAHLFASLVKREAFLCKAMDDFLAAEYRSRQTKGSDLSELDNSGDGSSPNSDIDNILVSAHSYESYAPASSVVLECGSSTKEKKQKWDRLQEYDRWIWGSFYSSLNAVKNYNRPYMESLTHCASCHDLYWRDEKHCKVCHSTFEINIDLEERYAIHVATCRETDNNRDFPKHKVLPSQLQALKAAIHSIEGSMPPVAFSGGWKCSAHKLWEKRLRRTSSLLELIQVVSDFVSAINEEWLYQNPLSLSSTASLDEVIIYFQTMPKTTSAVALWMVKLDRLVAPYLEKLKSDRNLPNRRTQLKVLQKSP